MSPSPTSATTVATTAAAAAAATASTSNSPLLAVSTNKLNRKWILKRRPIGIFDPKTDAELVDETKDAATADATKPFPADHQVIVEPEVLSVDAFLRTMYDEDAYHGSLPLGSTLPALGYGRVVWAGPTSGHKAGTRVTGMLAASDRAVVNGKSLFKSVKMPCMPRSTTLGLMGLTTGLTAYTGVFYVPSKPPRRGETVVVTGAAGAVGSVAVQLAKSTGARVVGIAGGPRKTRYLRETLGCDATIDYKDTTKTGSLESQIAETCPNGIDFVYDNVGGETLDALLEKINPRARIVICGAISQYSNSNGRSRCSVRGPSNYLKLAERGAEMRGFNVYQYITRLPFMLCGMFYLWARGKISLNEHVEEGLESFPYALQKLFTGKTIGKTLVVLKKEE